MTPVLSSISVPQLYQLLLDGEPDERAILLDYVKEHWDNWQGWEWLAREGKLPDNFPSFKKYPWTWWSESFGFKNKKQSLPMEVMGRLSGILYRDYEAMRDYPTLESALIDAARAAQQAINAGEIK